MLADSEFIAFLVQAQALQFGSFTLKSGRVSPYFFNSARFHTGPRLMRLAQHFARTVQAHAPRATIVFGPAYKGIPLAVATAAALSTATGREVGYLFNRKEAKTHGDAGLFVGKTPGPDDRLVIVDDVITDGQTKLEAVAALRATFDTPIDALVIAFNRMEQDAAGRDALHEFERATGIPVQAIVSLAELEAALAGGMLRELGPGAPPVAQVLAGIRQYRARYGSSSAH
ncbi:MAG: orotate phosphoribosyltransferase [Candidatus Lambdaproteobacteria bacterium]|nr:orotate phosphoribosyltransferase [Candidatus Lambdaproteobacteria bacterium]